MTVAFVKRKEKEKLKTKIQSKKKYEISLLLLIQKSNYTVLFVGLQIVFKCYSYYPFPELCFVSIKSC